MARISEGESSYSFTNSPIDANSSRSSSSLLSCGGVWILKTPYSNRLAEAWFANNIHSSISECDGVPVSTDVSFSSCPASMRSFISSLLKSKPSCNLRFRSRCVIFCSGSRYSKILFSFSASIYFPSLSIILSISS